MDVRNMRPDMIGTYSNEEKEELKKNEKKYEHADEEYFDQEQEHHIFIEGSPLEPYTMMVPENLGLSRFKKQKKYWA